MKDGYLESLANGTETRISTATSQLGSLFQNKLNDIGDAMTQGGAVDYVDLNGSLNINYDYTSFGKGLQASPNLRVLNLSGNALSAESAQHIADGIRGKQHLTSVQLSRCEMDAEATNILADALATCPNLNNLEIDSNHFGDESMGALNNAVMNMPKLEKLSINYSGVTAEGVEQMGDAIRNAHRLTILNCDSKSPKQRRGINSYLQDFTAQHEHLRLIMLTPTMDVAFPLCTANRQGLEKLSKEVLPPNNIEDTPAHRLGMAYDQTRGMLLVNPGAADKIDMYVNSLPYADADINVAKLTETGANGRSLLDNPRMWQNLPKVLDALEEKGEKLTLDHLLQTNRDGDAFLTVGLATAPDSVIPALNAHGIQLTADVLLSNGKPSAHLEAVIERKAGAELFTMNNWNGHHPAEMTQVHKLLPPAQQEQTSYFRLAHDLQQARQQTKEMGRA